MEKNVSITELWGVPIYYVNYTKPLTSKIYEKCVELCPTESSFNALNLSKNNYVLNLEDFFEIKYFINLHLQNYIENFFGISQHVFITNSFVSIKERGQFHSYHPHPNSLVSGTYYISVPENSVLSFQDQPKIMEGYKNIDFSIKNVNRYNVKKWNFNLKKGDLFIFPSNIIHGTNVNECNDKKIVLSFNTFFKGLYVSDGYCTDLII